MMRGCQPILVKENAREIIRYVRWANNALVTGSLHPPVAEMWPCGLATIPKSNSKTSTEQNYTFCYCITISQSFIPCSAEQGTGDTVCDQLQPDSVVMGMCRSQGGGNTLTLGQKDTVLSFSAPGLSAWPC